MTPTTAQENALLEALYDRFDDPAPRRAWADWLDAQGSPWGAVVRAAVDASVRQKKPGRAALAAEAAHAAHGFGPLAGSASQVGACFDRGALAGFVFGADIWNRATLDFGGEPPYFANRAGPYAARDPRWRGLRWLHNLAGEDLLALVRAARLERLTQLTNASARTAHAMAGLPVAARITELGVYVYPRDAALMTPALLDGFPALTRLALADLRGTRIPGQPADLHWLADSDVARTRLRRIEGLDIHDLAAAVALLPQLGAVEVVGLSSVELLRTPAGIELSCIRFGPWIDDRLSALPRGAVATISVDPRELAKGKHGPARLQALADRLGAQAVALSPAEARARKEAWVWTR